MKESKQWRLNLRNFLRGGLFAALPPVILNIGPILKGGEFPDITDLKKTGAYALGYFLFYILAHLPTGEK